MALRNWSKNRKVASTSRRCKELQKRSIPMSRRFQTRSQSLGLVWVNFQPILSLEFRVLKLNPKETKGRQLGLGEGDFVHTLGPRKRL